MTSSLSVAPLTMTGSVAMMTSHIPQLGWNGSAARHLRKHRQVLNMVVHIRMYHLCLGFYNASGAHNYCRDVHWLLLLLILQKEEAKFSSCILHKMVT